VASPELQALLDGPKGAAVKTVPLPLTSFALTQTQALPPKQKRLLPTAKESYIGILIYSVAEESYGFGGCF